MQYTVLPPPRHLRRAWRYLDEYAVLAIRVSRDGTGPTEYLLQPLDGGQTFWYAPGDWSNNQPPLFFDRQTAVRELYKSAAKEEQRDVRKKVTPDGGE